MQELSGRLRYIIETRFGTYEEAVVAWGIPRSEYKEHRLEGQNKVMQTRVENDFIPKYTVEEVKEKYMSFFELKGRFHTWGEVKQYGVPGRVPFKRAFGEEKRILEKQLRFN